MITTARRIRVSAALLALGVALGACARGPAPFTGEQNRILIHFDNQAETYADVYLIGDKREWWLGRVAPGAHALLRIPDRAEVATSSFVRLAVLPGASLTMQAARDPRAAVTIAQPPSELLGQQWTFSHRQMASAEIVGAPMAAGRP